MNEFGYLCLCLAWLLSLYSFAIGAYGGAISKSALQRSCAFTVSASNAAIGVFLCLGLCILALSYSFLTNDYTNQYVWQYSNLDMEPMYKISAIWGGMDGSMLLWAFLLSVSVAIVAMRSDRYPRTLTPWVVAVLSSSLLFFITVVLFLTNPFRFLNASFIPPDGNGLNPLLQNPYMAVHPPLLYLGFTTQAVPYAFCMAALLSGNLSNEWIRLTRAWALVAWGFLTAGIVMGGHWAYLELGWGGFWAWDPVENASFLPWLTSTAFLHSVMVQERKDMLKFWNVWLNVLTYALTVFGTFLTRSGIVQSVHAFASTDVGWVFLGYLGLIFAVAAILSYVRRTALRSDRKIESFLSREAFFLMNNLVLLSICFAVLWGVMFPVLSEAVTGSKQAVGIPFFNTVNVPLFLLLLLLMGVGPMIAWKKAAVSRTLKTFLMPLLTALFLCSFLVWVGIDEFYPLLSYGLCWFITTSIFVELHRGLRAQKLAGEGLPDGFVYRFGKLVRRHRARYGGYLVHIGVVIAAVSITASMAHKFEKEFSLKVGETIAVRRFNLRLDEIRPVRTKNFEAVQARITVMAANSGEVLGTYAPEMRSYFRNQESTTEVAIRMGMREDLYLVFIGLDEAGTQAGIKVFVNPLQVWLWYGAIIMVIGVVVIVAPSFGKVPVTSAGMSSKVVART